MGNNSSIDLQFMGELQTKVDCYKDCLCKGRILENGVFVDKCPNAICIDKICECGEGCVYDSKMN
jgi:hypothetical protein